MTFHSPLDFRPPSADISMDRKPNLIHDDNESLEVFDPTSIMSPIISQQHDYTDFTDSLFSPQTTNLFDDYTPTSCIDRNASLSTNNPFFEQNNNPFTRLPASQAASYGQYSNWSISDDFDVTTNPYMPPQANVVPILDALPIQNNVRPSSVFPPSQSDSTPLPASPHSNKDWMAMAARERESRPLTKRMRQNTPPRSYSPFPRRDGIRKKNARFDIPAERSLNNIDELIARSTNEDDIKELKQQKRLLRNRQAALDSRQRKKKHTEDLESEKKAYTERIQQLQDELANMRIQANSHMKEREKWRRQQIEHQNQLNTLQWDKQELVRKHTIETGHLRRKVSALQERLEVGSMPMSAAPSSTLTDFAIDMDNLNMGTDMEYNFVNDFFDPDAMNTPQPPLQQADTALVISDVDKKEVEMDEKMDPGASGFLLMLLLCGAFVASNSGSSAPPIPRMPEHVRAASFTVLDSIFKDAGVTPSPSSKNQETSQLVVNSIRDLDPDSTPSGWGKPNFSGVNFGSISQQSSLDRLHDHLSAPTKDQETEQLFSMTPSQYNSLTSADFTRSVYGSSGDDNSDGFSDTQPSLPRRNLAEALAAMREESRGECASNVYTRSLLWDRIPKEVVIDFKRMMEESNSINGAGGG